MNISIKLSGGDWHAADDTIWSGEFPGGESIRPGSAVVVNLENGKAVFKVIMCGARIIETSPEKTAKKIVKKKTFITELVIYVAPFTQADAADAQRLLGRHV